MFLTYQALRPQLYKQRLQRGFLKSWKSRKRLKNGCRSLLPVVLKQGKNVNRKFFVSCHGHWFAETGTTPVAKKAKSFTLTELSKFVNLNDCQLHMDDGTHDISHLAKDMDISVFLPADYVEVILQAAKYGVQNVQDGYLLRQAISSIANKISQTIYKDKLDSKK